MLRLLGGPQIVAPVSNRVIGLNTPLVINLADKFTDSDAETAVRMETTKGNVDILLFPSLAPEGVANFMTYVRSGSYDNMAFHRLEPGFVLQAAVLKLSPVRKHLVRYLRTRAYGCKISRGISNTKRYGGCCESGRAQFHLFRIRGADD